MESTWVGHMGCGDHVVTIGNVKTKWGQSWGPNHEDNVETTWAQCGDHRDVDDHVETPPPMCGCMGGWVDGWVHMDESMGGVPGHITKNPINLELIEIIQFYFKICDLLRHPHLWVGVWVVGWSSGLYGWVNGWGTRSNH